VCVREREREEERVRKEKEQEQTKNDHTNRTDIKMIYTNNNDLHLMVFRRPKLLRKKITALN